VEGLRNVKGINVQLTIGNGHTIAATKLGDPKCEVTQFNGSTFEVTFREVKYVPELWINLFSINNQSKMDSN
jgi:hypothetical protein